MKKVRSSRRRVRGVVICAALAGLVAAGAPAVAVASTTTNPIALTSLTFAPTTVDTTTGSSTTNLTWTVTDANTAARSLHGTLEIRQTADDGLTGPAYDVPFGTSPGSTPTVLAQFGSTAQSSTYSYQFAVPLYTADSRAVWKIVRVTAADDSGHGFTAGAPALKAFEPGDTVHAVETADASVPAIGSVGFTDFNTPTYFNNANSAVTLDYQIEVTSADAGFWRGMVRVKGPGSQMIRVPFALTQYVDGSSLCGDEPSWGASDVFCEVKVTIPRNAAAGTWTLDGVDLTDTAGATGSYRHLGDLPVQITQNAVLSAGGFSVDPTAVNNWSSMASIALSFTPVGARDGIASVTVTTNPECGGAVANDPPVAADGSLTVHFFMPPTYPKQCTVTGIAVIDGAGDLAAYGSEFNGPALDLVVNQIPDTSPPVVLSATFRSSTTTQSQGELLTINVSSFAGVSEVELFLYNTATGQGGEYDFGGVPSVDGDTIPWGINTSGMAPGTYQVAFALDDNGGLSSWWGFPAGVSPNSQPLPGGPLQFTLTADTNS